MIGETSREKIALIIIQPEGPFNTGILLIETNYDVWSQIMEMHLAEQEKISYIRGKIPQSKESSEGYEKWYAKIQKVKRVLLMSITPEIMKRYLQIPTA